MLSSLAERLRAARHRRFVGRTYELDLFQSVVLATELPFYVLHVFGLGGVGKTTLLWEFVRLCQDAKISAVYVDARNIEPSPDGFINALRFVLGIESSASPLQILTTRTSRQVILIDTYELIEPLDAWLREVFLPQLPADTLIVLAGRHAPTAAWRADLGWQSLIHTLPLRNLSPEESRIYLSHHQIPLTQHQAVLNFTHGYPLALSLVADVFGQSQDIGFQPEAMPDVIKVLMEKLLQEVPSPAHRMALEACALVRLTTEALLAAMLGISDPTELLQSSHSGDSLVYELFDWLRGLSFIELGQPGLFPHDLAREVLAADLRWRNPDWYAELHRRARNYYTTRLAQTQDQEQHRVLFDYIFLHRDNPAVRPRFTWQESGSLVTDSLRETDPPLLIKMVAEHEGEDSAHLATYWLTQQPQNVLVFRDAEQQPAGFVMMLALHQTSLEDRKLDPAAEAAWTYLHNNAPLRTGEGATLFRFWMAGDTYQQVSQTQSLIFINFVQHHRNTAGLAFTFFPCAEPAYWAAMFAYADLARISAADFEVGGRAYGVYGHDWRVVPPTTWQELLAQREIAASAQAIASTQVSEPLVVLSQPEFAEAVREALRNFAAPARLHQNPLLQSRLVMDQVSPNASRAERITALQSLIQEVAQSLQASPREAKCYRALYHTYLHPVPTQEQAAELLDLPFSTFRRHLKAGVIRVADLLWHREIGS